VSFWDIVWFIFISFIFIAYLMILFSIISDLFRDHETGGFAKALWVIALLVLPFLTALIYLVARGHGMAERSAQQAKEMKQAQDDYIRGVAGATPAEQIARAKELLDSGAISQTEYEQLKTKALG
jgi:hypothetical protein